MGNRGRSGMTFEKDSPNVDRVYASGGYSRGKYLERFIPARGIAIHTTGSGIARRWMNRKQRNRWGWKSIMDCALWVYRQMDAGPHYVIDQDGTLAQTCPEDHCAWHIGGSKSAPYFSKRDWSTTRTQWWRERWPTLENPRDLAGGQAWAPYVKPKGLRIRVSSGWNRGSANANLLGVEIVPPIHNPARGEWSKACWRTLARLCLDTSSRHGFPAEAEFMATHSDYHPLARTTKGGDPWDVRVQQFTWKQLAEEMNRCL